MTDRPLSFSAPMVRALLDGRKTQTRRVLKPQPVEPFVGPEICHPTVLDRHGEEQPGKSFFGITHPDGDWCRRLPYATADRLWVKETWRTLQTWDDDAPGNIDPDWAMHSLDYMATPYDGLKWGRYRHARFMPRWASRLTLTVTDVRVQRLQDISEADAVAEGLVATHEGWATDRQGSCWGPTAAAAYRVLWNSLHGPDAWDANPWVVAVTFTARADNIDAGGEA